MITETPGGLGAFLDRLRKGGLGDFVSSWLGGSSPRPISSNTLEAALGHGPIDKIASKAGLSFSTVSSALAFMLPNIIRRLTPGGVIPTHLSSDMLSYASSATSTVAAGTRQAAYAAERAVKKAGVPAWLWPLLAALAIVVLGYWFWNSRASVQTPPSTSRSRFAWLVKRQPLRWCAQTGFHGPGPGISPEPRRDQLRYRQRSDSCDQYDFLSKVAVAIKAAPANTVLKSVDTRIIPAMLVPT